MLAASGVKVAIFDMQRERGEAVAKEIGALFCEADVTNEQGVDAALSAARAAHGVERVLVLLRGRRACQAHGFEKARDRRTHRP